MEQRTTVGFRRLDHLVCYVPDIFRAHLSVRALGFAEAWPIGPFWPQALTSGFALGGLNLELVQPDAGVKTIAATKLVFEPTSLETAESALAEAGITFRRLEKVESNPELLLLRGFSAQESLQPQPICTNLLPENPTPFDFFLCDYAPFLKARLGPDSFDAPHGEVQAIELEVRNPEASEAVLAKVGYSGVELRFVKGSSTRVGLIHFADGTCLSLGPKAFQQN